MSSEICPMQWHTECLILETGLSCKASTISMMGWMMLMSSMYSPTCDKAMIAAFLYLQSYWAMYSCTTPPRVGNMCFSPTADISLSTPWIPKLTSSVSTSPFSCSSEKPSLGVSQSASISLSIYTIFLKIISITSLNS